jgi:outer membrane protein insertion porin family
MAAIVRPVMAFRNKLRPSPSVLVVLAGVAGGVGGGVGVQGQEPPRAVSPLVAQDQPDPYEDRPIREVRLLRAEEGGKTSPLTGPNAQLALNQIRTLPGRPFRRQTVTQDISTLGGLGRFKTISAQVQLQTDGSVVVIYVLGEQPIIEDVQVVGNRVISDQEALAIAGALSGTAVDRFEIDRAARGIENLYREKGYYAVRVEVDEKELAASGILVYRIIEGERVRVMGVQFEGNVSFTARELRSAIRTTEYVPVFESGPLDDEVVQADVAELTKFYRDRGYLQVRASSRVTPAPNGKEAIVTFVVDEGPLYTLRSVKVRYVTPSAVAEYRERFAPDVRQIGSLTPEQMAKLGRRCFTNEQAAGLMLLKAGDVYSLDKLNKSKAAIKAAYGTLGYIVDNVILGPGDVIVTEREVLNPERPEVDLVLEINEGKPAVAGMVTVLGNEKTRQQVILHNILVRPGRPLNVADVAESRKRLEASRLFERGSVRATIQPERPDEPGVRDVLVEVTETNTGEFNFGVAVDSDAGLVGQFTVTQRNFDLFDPPRSAGELFSATGFRGGGQTARLEILPGNLSQRYSVSLTEPHFLDSDYSATGRVYLNTRRYRVYDEERLGTGFGIGRRFGTVWEGSVGARVELVDISDVEPSSTVDLFEAEGQNLMTSVGVRLTRDTTDDRLRPSRGSYTSLGVDQFGALGGDYSFTRIAAGYKAFITLHESFLGYKTVLKLDSSVGYIPQGQGEAPLFERLYLGGQSFRGFSNRGVSPVGIRKDTGQLGRDPVGGSFSCFFGAEVNQPVYEDVIGAVAFIDTGTVQESFGLDQYRVSVGVGMRVFIPQVSPVPLAFDFGFPLLKEDTDRKRLFTFSIDVPF